MISFRDKKRLMINNIIVIIILFFSIPTSAFGFDQGVVIGQPHAAKPVLQPFIIMNKKFVLDPSTGQMILLLPSIETEEQVRVVGPEVKTVKEVIRKSLSETEIGTITIKKK